MTASTPRRLWALVQGLPPESATWRKTAFPPVEEMLATLIEREDAWSRALVAIKCGQRKITVPAPLQILRPGQEPPQRKIEKDPRKLAEFLGGRR